MLQSIRSSEIAHRIPAGLPYPKRLKASPFRRDSKIIKPWGIHGTHFADQFESGVSPAFSKGVSGLALRAQSQKLCPNLRLPSFFEHEHVEIALDAPARMRPCKPCILLYANLNLQAQPESVNSHLEQTSTKVQRTLYTAGKILKHWNHRAIIQPVRRPSEKGQGYGMDVTETYLQTYRGNFSTAEHRV